ncbi:MAG TPA: hypothetical protein PLP19_19005 [bacterium]|nr:hypothetical protein [bacterium]HPN45586.1 hypothetical protein [bacterium]
MEDKIMLGKKHLDESKDETVQLGQSDNRNTKNEKDSIETTFSISLARSLLNVLEITRPNLFGFGLLNLEFLLPWKREERRKTLEEKKLSLVKNLLESNIDPKVFDILLQNEIDRMLKVKFGTAFLLITVFFSIVSYSIVILDGILKWNVSQIAITSLIIETPIQFVGLLYIIARNLFPQITNRNNDLTNKYEDD